MKKTPVADIPADAVLGSDVLDDNGNVLLGKGTKLTGKHKGMLERRGVETVILIDASEAAVEATKEMAKEAAEHAANQQAGNDGPDEAAQARMAAVEKMFSDVLDDPLMGELYSLALKRARLGGIGV